MAAVTRSSGILMAIALGAACVGSAAESGDPDSGTIETATSVSEKAEIYWPIARGVSSFITQSAARSGEPFPCGSGVNARHILAGKHGDNHDYEHSLDIVARNRDGGAWRVAHDGRGTDVVAVADGVVVATNTEQSECDRTLGAGNFVIVEHPQLSKNGKPVLSAYMHLNSKASVERSMNCSLNSNAIEEGAFVMPAVGAAVHAGEKIGELGNTGNSTGTHLHFQFASSCTLAPMDSIECKALPVLEVSPSGFADLTIARDQSCPAPTAVGGPVSELPSSENYLSDGTYVMSRFGASPLYDSTASLASR